MSNAATSILKGLIKGTLVLGILAVIILAVLVAWWIALIAAGAWLLVSATSRMLGGKRDGSPMRSRPPANAAIIEGEYRVESDGSTPISAPGVTSDPGKPGT
jgi:hypothetical protein